MRTMTILAIALLAPAFATAGPARVTGRYAPAPPVQTVPLRELWRVTDGNEETGDILGEIKDATADAAGNTYLLDANFNTVRIYDPAGKSLGTLGRAGEGPGEFSNPRRCLALADGRLGVAQFLPARIVTFDRNGNPGPDLHPPETGSVEIMESVQAAAGGVYLSTHSMIMGGDAPRSVMRLRSLALDGSPRALFKEASQEVGRNGVFSSTASDGSDFTQCWAAGADGRLFVAPRYDAYQIEVFAPDGTLEWVIELEYEHVKQRAAETEEPAARRALPPERGRTAAGSPALRDVAALFARPDGVLWVLSSRSERDRPTGTVGAFDVFDREGRFTGRIALAADYDPEADKFVISGNRLYVLKESLMAPRTAASASGGATTVWVDTPAARDQGSQDPRPYAVICCELAGI